MPQFFLGLFIHSRALATTCGTLDMDLFIYLLYLWNMCSLTKEQSILSSETIQFKMYLFFRTMPRFRLRLFILSRALAPICGTLDMVLFSCCRVIILL